MNVDQQLYSSLQQNSFEYQFTPEALQKALNSFYFPTGGDLSQINEINHWLMLFQDSNAAWELAPLLLQSSILEFRLFGATTIDLKIKSSFNTLSDDLKLSILEKVLVYLRNNPISPLTSSTTITNNNSNSNSNSNNNNNGNNGNNSSNGNGNNIATLNSDDNNNNNNSNKLKVEGNIPSSVVISKLCVIVSEIACYTSLDLWKNPIYDIISFAFPDLDNLESFYPTQLSLILELLTLFPHELLNSDYITQEKRNKIGREFMKYSGKVIQIISKVMSLPINQQTIDFMKKSFKCFKSWALFDIPPQEYLIDNQLILQCLDQVSKSPILAEEFIHLLDDLFSFMRGKIFKTYPLSFPPILEKIVDIFSAYYGLALKENDENICHAIFNLFSNIADNHTKLLLGNNIHSNDNNNINIVSDKLFKVYIEIFKITDIESCELISHVISNIHSLYESEVDISRWYPLLLEFIEAIRLRCMYPTQYSISQLSKEDQEKFFDFRKNVGCDSILEIFTVIEQKTTETLMSRLWDDIQRYPNSTWQSLESTVYLLGCLSEGIIDDSFVPQLFQLLSQLPIQSTPLIKSTIILAGKYANLLEKSNLFIEKIVVDFVAAFQKPDLKLVASDSFLSISKNTHCSKLLSNNIDSLVKVCEPYLLSSSNNLSILSQYKLEESNNNILEALLNIISCLPKDKILFYLSSLIIPYINLIEELSKIINKSPFQPKEKELFLQIMKLLINICKIFDPEVNYNLTSNGNNSNNNSPVKSNSNSNNNSPKSNKSGNSNSNTNGNNNNNSPNNTNNDEDHIILPFVKYLIPIFNSILNNSNNIDLLILESICQYYKNVLLTCNRSSIIVAPDICKQLVEIFIKKPTPAILVTLSVLISVLNNENYYEFLFQTLNLITPLVIEIWKKNADFHQLKPNEQTHLIFIQQQQLRHPTIPFIEMKYNLSMIPDLTKEYFSLVQQFLKYNVNSLPVWIIQPLFQITYENILNIHHKNTARSIFSFLANLIQKSVEKKERANWQPVIQEIDKMLQTNGENLIKQVFYAIGGASERSIIFPFISDIIYSLVNSYPQVFRSISQTLLMTDGFPSTKISRQQKIDFLNSIMMRQRKTQTKAIEDFNLFSLGKSEK